MAVGLVTSCCLPSGALSGLTLWPTERLLWQFLPWELSFFKSWVQVTQFQPKTRLINLMLIEKLDLPWWEELMNRRPGCHLQSLYTTYAFVGAGSSLGKESGRLHVLRRKPLSLVLRISPGVAGWTQHSADFWQVAKCEGRSLRQLDVRFWECPWPRRQLSTGATGKHFFIHFRKAGRRTCRAYSEPPLNCSLSVHVSPT